MLLCVFQHQQMFCSCLLSYVLFRLNLPDVGLLRRLGQQKSKGGSRHGGCLAAACSMDHGCLILCSSSPRLWCSSACGTSASAACCGCCLVRADTPVAFLGCSSISIAQHLDCVLSFTGSLWCRHACR